MMEFGTVNPSEAAKEYASLDEFPEKSPEDVEEKKKKYAALTESDSMANVKSIVRRLDCCFLLATKRYVLIHQLMLP